MINLSLTDSYPPAAFYFSVNIGNFPNPLDSSFQEVSGIELQMDTEQLVEGGENRFVHVLPKGVKQQTLKLKRGIAGATSPLMLWCKAVLEGGLATSITPQLVMVTLLNIELTALRSWSFSNAWPVRWEIEPFNSTKNDIAIEQVELAYLSATRMI